MQLFLLNACWFYGLFRRDAMLRILPETLEDYPYLSGSDVIALIPFAFDRKIIGTNRTSWIGYMRFPGPRPNYRQRAVRDVAKFDRLSFLLKYAHRHVDRVIEGRFERAFHHLVIWYYGHKSGLTWSKRLRIMLNQAIGVAPPMSSQRQSR
jgi:hypothetical protein